MIKLPYRFAKEHQIILDYAVVDAISNNHDSENSDFIANYDKEKYLFLYSVNELNPIIIQNVVSFLGHSDFKICIVEQAKFSQILQSNYQTQDANTSEAIEALSEEFDLSSFKAEFAKAQDLLDQNDDAPIIKFINALLTKAIKEKSSDIHFESFEHRIAIRMRIDGILQEVMTPPVELAPFIIARLKVMSGLDIAEKRLPQDGRISTQIAGRTVDIRVSTLPVANFERIVLRILDKNASSFALPSLGMPNEIEQKLSELIHLPHGIILVVGPTGSGKTTTLYAALASLDITRKNIMTVEDPIEYFLDGISQTQVNIKAGMDFAKGLRAILRQDPDVVMVGEIRDSETAQMAVQASLTGHTVFSTLHTNTAIGAIVRLRDMGIEPFLIGSSLAGVLSQRLVRKLCPYCKTQIKIDDPNNISERLFSVAIEYYQATGCRDCRESGYHGRIGVYELITIDDEVRKLISVNANESEMEKIVRQKSSRLFDNGIRLVESGVTSPEELIRVVGSI